jgi:hypothetical protein
MSDVEDLGPLPYASKVEAMAGYGLSPADIARVLDIDVEELKTSYEKERAGGHIKANARVAGSLYRKAIGEGRESVTAAIFWLKTRARWKETSVHELAGGPGERKADLTTWSDEMLEAAIRGLSVEVSAE